MPTAAENQGIGYSDYLEAKRYSGGAVIAFESASGAVCGVYQEDAVLLDLVFHVEGFIFGAGEETRMIVPRESLVEAFEELHRKTNCPCVILHEDENGEWVPCETWIRGSSRG